MIGVVYKNYLQKLSPYFGKNIREVVINKPCQVGTENLRGEWKWHINKDLDLSWCQGFASAFASFSGQKFSEKDPMISFQIPRFGDKPEELGGHRVQLFAGDIVESGFAMTIRIHKNSVFLLEDYIISDEDKNKIVDAVRSKKTLLISAGTAVGKTSFLNMLLSFIDKKERLVLIEGVPELKTDIENLVRLLYSENQTSASNISAKDLLIATLRSRPDRIILGELRQDNSFVFFRAINTGHDGSIATIHANSEDEAINAVVEYIILNGDASLESEAILRKKLLSRIHGVIQLEKRESKVFGTFKELRI